MRKGLLTWAALSWCVLSGAALAESKAEIKTGAPTARAVLAPHVPVEQYTLKNGLTVLLSPDPRVPIVATELVYLVGSSYEEKGRTGFAHLFEHLMFQGSAHHDAEYFEPFEPIGAEVNGTTDKDRTNYYEHVPSQYAELSLWMESDRMRSLSEVLSEEKLNNQRDVVKNERRQRYEVAPYGMAFWHLDHALFPDGHPYQHSPIGSHEDLEKARLDEVKAFFVRYYVPKNAGLIVAGDFDVAKMKELIERYFADIPSGERAAAPKVARPELKASVHMIAEDDVELPRVHLAFHTPALFERGDAELDLLSSVLSDGKSSRLYQKLVYEEKVASDVAAFQMSEKLSSVFIVQATAARGVSAEALGKSLEAALKTALGTPPTDDELTRAKNTFKKGFFHRVESVGDRASLLGSYFLHTGVGDYVAKDYERYVVANESSVHDAGVRFLSANPHVRLDVVRGKKSTPLKSVPSESPVATSGEKK